MRRAPITFADAGLGVSGARSSIARDAVTNSMDITEIESTKDSDDERTTRLAALVILEAIAGLSTRI